MQARRPSHAAQLSFHVVEACKKGRLALAAGLLAALVVAAPAHAASIAVGGSCYLDTDMIIVTGIGFTPRADVTYAFDGVASGFGSADPAGDVSQQVPAPALPAGTIEHTYNLTATDQSNLTNVGTVPVRVTRLTATLSPQKARPSRRIRFAVHGMPPGVELYLHYVYKGRSRATVPLGKPSSPCGILVVKRRFFPMRNPHVGTWTFQFDDKKSYSPNTRPAVRGSVVLFHSGH